MTEVISFACVFLCAAALAGIVALLIAAIFGDID